MERRDFIKLCASSAAACSLPVDAADARAHLYARSLLVTADGKPLRAGAIPAKQNLIFHYPYASTPCFLLNLGKPAQPGASLKTADNRSYQWSGGVGPARSVVAYSAICAHKLTYPTREISFISFRAEKSPGNRIADVIHCCSEHSQYDPAQGARVVAGPAPQPLAAILLEWDAAKDETYAVGTLGGEMFNQFFAKYEFRLAMEMGAAAHRAVDGTTVVQQLDHFCRQQVKC